MVDVTATGRDVHNARAFTRDDVGAASRIAATVNDAMTIHAATAKLIFINRHAAWLLLRFQIIKRPFILPADHVGTLDRSKFIEAALFLEELGECFQLADAFRPFPFRASKAVAEFGRQSLKVEIVFCEVVDGIVPFGLDFDVVQIGIDRTGDVAGKRPRGCGPDEEVFRGC